MYNKVTEQDLAILRAIVGDTEVLAGDAINPDYSHDELGGISRMPEVLVRVRSTEQVSAIMRHAYERTIPVTVRGSGTGLVGAAVPIEGARERFIIYSAKYPFNSSFIIPIKKPGAVFSAVSICFVAKS